MTHTERIERPPLVSAAIQSVATDAYLDRQRAKHIAFESGMPSLQVLAAEKRSNEFAADAQLPHLVQINTFPESNPVTACQTSLPRSRPDSLSMFLDVNTRAFYYAIAPLNSSHIQVPAQSGQPPVLDSSQARRTQTLTPTMLASDTRSRSPLSVVAAHIRKRLQLRQKGFGPADIDLMSIDELVTDTHFTHGEHDTNQSAMSPFVSLDPLPVPRGRVALLAATHTARDHTKRSLNTIPSVLNSMELSDENSHSEHFNVRSHRRLDELQHFQSGRQTLAQILDDPLFSIDPNPCRDRAKPSDNDVSLSDSIDDQQVFGVHLRRPIPPSPGARFRLRTFERRRNDVNKLLKARAERSLGSVDSNECESFESTTHKTIRSGKAASTRPAHRSDAAILNGERDFISFRVGRTVIDAEMSELVHIGSDDDNDRYADVDVLQRNVPKMKADISSAVDSASNDMMSDLSNASSDSMCLSPLAPLRDQSPIKSMPPTDFDQLSDLSELSIHAGHSIVVDDEFEFQSTRQCELSPQSVVADTWSVPSEIVDAPDNSALGLQLPSWASEIAATNI